MSAKDAPIAYGRSAYPCTCRFDRSDHNWRSVSACVRHGIQAGQRVPGAPPLVIDWADRAVFIDRVAPTVRNHDEWRQRLAAAKMWEARQQ